MFLHKVSRFLFLRADNELHLIHICILCCGNFSTVVVIFSNSFFQLNFSEFILTCLFFLSLFFTAICDLPPLRLCVGSLHI